jgi:hypothetical protein
MWAENFTHEHNAKSHAQKHHHNEEMSKKSSLRHTFVSCTYCVSHLNIKMTFCERTKNRRGAAKIKFFAIQQHVNTKWEMFYTKLSTYFFFTISILWRYHVFHVLTNGLLYFTRYSSFFSPTACSLICWMNDLHFHWYLLSFLSLNKRGVECLKMTLRGNGTK